jgi:hypothetical protein
MFAIFEITCIPNAKSYIGINKVKNSEAKAEEIPPYFANEKISNDLFKYGPAAFERKIIKIVDTKEQADRLKIFYVQALHTDVYGYNILADLDMEEDFGGDLMYHFSLKGPSDF